MIIFPHNKLNTTISGIRVRVRRSLVHLHRAIYRLDEHKLNRQENFALQQQLLAAAASTIMQLTRMDRECNASTVRAASASTRLAA